MDQETDDNQIFRSIQNVSLMPLAKRAGWFSSVAREYDLTRPAYPVRLVEQVVDRCLIGTSSNLLEIGCGPGTATPAFAKSGCKIQCLEPNPEFCEIARNKLSPFPRVAIECIALEEAVLPSRAFDVVVAANSMHWMPVDDAFPKVASALKNDGFLVNLWNKELFPLPAFGECLMCIYQDHNLDLPVYQDAQLQCRYLNALGQLMVRSGLFSLVETGFAEELYDYSADQYISLLSTYSSYLALDADLRESLFASIRRCILDAGSTIPLSCLSAFHIGVKNSG